MSKNRNNPIEGAKQLLSQRRITRKEFGRWLTGAVSAALTTQTLGGCDVPDDRADDSLGRSNIDFDYQAVIVGSGFGGSVMGARLSRKWPGAVMMAERGRRYPRGSFPRDKQALFDAIRRDPTDNTPRPLPLQGTSNGLFDVRSYDGMDVLVANGYGGGSLIYGAAIIEPEDPDFDKDWPATIKKDQLKPYYDIFKTILGAGPIPITDEPERQLPRVDYYKRVAEETGGESKLVPIGIFFGNDPDNPTPLGEREINQHGAEQTSCTYCAECVVGCNFHAKSSMDLNFLHVAENRYGMEVRTEHAVERVVPLDIDGNDDPDQDGGYGYRVYMKDLGNASAELSVTAQRVVLSAGVLGTTEILLRNKYVHGTLPNVSQQLGRGFSGNGDFVGLVAGGDLPDGNAYGPTLVQSINYRDASDPEEHHVLEDLALPHLTEVISWLLDVCETNGPMHSFWQTLKALFELNGGGKNSGFASQVFVGVDKSNGKMFLGNKGELRLSWSHWASRKLFGSMIERIGDVKQAVSGWANLYLPTYLWPLRRNFTVHPLGGCALGDDSPEGVASAAREDFGRVFGYSHLYIADGSLVPSALGANPALTIAAFAEMVAEGVTGDLATVEL
ncbi:MAG: GMC family oxidoreductase N-terminal domain-containing protein [Deltaproteobacteria bacterium]|nr:GMC family oxidoreductase N-terminal domain-containing protein [Deltaproteobacteria bacterium]